MVRVKAAMAALAMRKTGVLLFMMSLLCSPAAGSAHRRHDTNTGRTDASSAAPLPTATRQSMTAWRARHAVRASGRSPDLQGRVSATRCPPPSRAMPSGVWRTTPAYRCGGSAGFSPASRAPVAGVSVGDRGAWGKAIVNALKAIRLRVDDGVAVAHRVSSHKERYPAPVGAHRVGGRHVAKVCRLSPTG